MLHLMAYSYPEQPTEERQQKMLDYISGMCSNLPCPGCQFHCKDYIDEHPPAVQSREMLTKYFIDFHNAVNKRTGKRELSYEEAEAELRQRFFQRNDWMDLKRAAEIRNEDHKVIDDLKTRLEEECQTCDNTGYVIAIIVLSMFLVFAGAAILYKLAL